MVRSNNNRHLSSEESPCFYEMLRAVKQLHPEELPKDALDFRQLLQNPDAHIGRAVQMAGHVRRAVRVEVDEPFLQQQFGLDHYFQLDMFVPLGGSKVVVNTAKSLRKKRREFRRQRDPTHCVRKPFSRYRLRCKFAVQRI